MKTEIREKEEKAGSMEAWSYAQYAGETETEREREKQKTLFQKIMHLTQCSLQCTYVCVQCTLLYKSFEGLTEVLSYFNAL